MFSSKAVQYMPHGCVVQFEVVYQGKNKSEVEISLCKHYWHRAWSLNFGIGIFEVPPKCLFLTNAGQRVSQILNLILLSVEILSLKQVLTYFVRESFTEQLTSLFFVWIHLICLCRKNNSFTCLFGQIQNSQTRGQLCSNTSPLW